MFRYKNPDTFPLEIKVGMEFSAAIKMQVFFNRDRDRKTVVLFMVIRLDQLRTDQTILFPDRKGIRLAVFIKVQIKATFTRHKLIFFQLCLFPDLLLVVEASPLHGELVFSNCNRYFYVL